MSNTFFGLDFGTANSVLSVNQGGSVRVINTDRYNTEGKTLRSVLYFNEEKEIFAGQQAINEYVDNDAEGRFMQSIKTFLPYKTFHSARIYGKMFHIEDLIAIILRKMKKAGEEYAGQSVDTVVMGRPVFFSENPEIDSLAENRLRAAAKNSGFKNISFQYEPVAAALILEETLSNREEQIVLVGDFGGGTSDFTIVKLRGGEKGKNNTRKDDILAINGVSIGGDAFDSAIMWEKIAKYFGKDVKIKTMTGQWLGISSMVTTNLLQWNLIPQLRNRSIREYIRQSKASADNVEVLNNLENLIEDNYGFMLFQAIEKAKCELSSKQNSIISFDEQKLSIKEAIMRNEFEEIIRDKISKIEECANEVVVQAGLRPNDIDLVLNTGGSSFIPRIRRIFVNKFGEDKIVEGDVFTSVAHGLGCDYPD